MSEQIINVASIHNGGTIVTLYGLDEAGRPAPIHWDSSMWNHFAQDHEGLRLPFKVAYDDEHKTVRVLEATSNNV